MNANIKRIIPILEKWEKIISAWDAQCEVMQRVLGIAPNGPLFDAIEHMADAYTAAIAKEVGDECSWLNYYRFDCKMGKDPRHVMLEKGKEILVDSIKKLAKVIE